MNTRRLRNCCFFMAALILSLHILTGCTIQTPVPREEVPSQSQAAPSSKDQEALSEQADFDSFMNELFIQYAQESQLSLHYVLKNPESYQISSASNAFGDPSLAGMQDAAREAREIVGRLDSYNQNQLLPEQKLTLRVLKDYLETELTSEGLELYSQPLAPTIGVQAQLPILLSEYALNTAADVEDYFQLISSIGDYFSEILVFEQQKADAGLMMSDRAIDHVISSCESYLLIPGDNFLSETFSDRLNGISGLTEEERADYVSRHEALLEQKFVPAYQTLISGLEMLKGSGINDGGLCEYPQGKEYYEYLVQSATGTSYTSVPKLLKAMKAQLADDLQTVSRVAQEHPEVLALARDYAFRQTSPSAILEELKALSIDDYPALTECSYTLKYVPKALELTLSPAFYLTPPLDDYQNNIIYINGGERNAGNNLYTVLAHEGYPGHLYQTVYFTNHCSHEIRHLLSFSGYTEGWATYVEHYAYMYDNGLEPALGELLAANSSAILGIQAMLDIYINYYGWSQEEVGKFLSDYYQNIQGTEVVQNIYDAMIEKPSNFLEYYVGYMEIQNLRRLAEKTLGESFQPKAFHEFILNIGPASFDVIQTYFSAWLATQKL